MKDETIMRLMNDPERLDLAIIAYARSANDYRTPRNVNEFNHMETIREIQGKVAQLVKVKFQMIPALEALRSMDVMGLSIRITDKYGAIRTGANEWRLCEICGDWIKHGTAEEIVLRAFRD